jgi:hypothetical protein
VSEKLPSVTVLIAARPGQAEVKAALAARALTGLMSSLRF